MLAMPLAMLLSPHSLVTHGGSSARGEDLLYSFINTLQRWDTTLNSLLVGAEALFGEKKGRY